MKCRHCQSDLRLSFMDLGSAPPSNRYLTAQTLKAPEAWYPLRVLVCERCWLVQTEDFAQANELFDEEYAYFSGFSQSWLAHCERYVRDMVERLALHATSHVIEVAANDGALLQYVCKRGIPCTGIEPTASTAAAARGKGIPVVEAFFDTSLARQLADEGRQADLMAANNVLAHVPDINDFVSAFAIALKPQGVATFEFPHLVELVRHVQFDTIYHEHFSYLSLTAVNRIFRENGLHVFDVQKLDTHGGSLRVFAQRADTTWHERKPRVDQLLEEEVNHGVNTADYYKDFQAKADAIKNDFLAFLLEAKRQGNTVAAYGAAAKGNTLMNYAGVRPDLITFVADRNPAKQGKYMPGSRIPIVEEGWVRQRKPNYVVVLPWNLKSEFLRQLGYVRDWAGQLIVAVPKISTL